MNKTYKEVDLILIEAKSLNDSLGLVLDKDNYVTDFYSLDVRDIVDKKYKAVKPVLVDTENHDKVLVSSWKIDYFSKHLSAYNIMVLRDKIAIKNILIEMETIAIVLPEKPKGEGWVAIFGEAMCVMYERPLLVDGVVVIGTTRKK